MDKNWMKIKKALLKSTTFKKLVRGSLNPDTYAEKVAKEIQTVELSKNGFNNK